ncbi:hypothetical protein WM31_27890 [Burkholderia ubonensis]|nr:hypothetical protein WM31_27890 [Burkholderia ubonensis]
MEVDNYPLSPIEPSKAFKGDAVPGETTSTGATSSSTAPQSSAALPNSEVANNLFGLTSRAIDRIRATIHPASLEDLNAFNANLPKPYKNALDAAEAFKRASNAELLTGAAADNPAVDKTVRYALLKTPALKQFHGDNGNQVNEKFYEAAWTDALRKAPNEGFNRTDPKSVKNFQGKVLLHYTGSVKNAANERFRESIVGAVQKGGFHDWKAGEGPTSNRVAPDDVAPWEHSTNDGESQRTSTRLADFVLRQDSSLRQKGTELQAIASSKHNRIVASMNNEQANLRLAQRYPNATALKNDLGKYIATELKTSPVEGSSMQNNANTPLRRAQELYNWLDKNPNAEFTVTTNTGGRHAEISVRQTIEEQHPELEKEGRAAGSKPPCTGCMLWFNERGELSEYQDELGRVPTGPLFMTPGSGMRTQFEASGVKPNKPENLSASDVEKVAHTVLRQVSNVKLPIHPVTSGDVDNIPRSPTFDDPTTPDYERAFDYGSKLLDQELPPSVAK